MVRAFSCVLGVLGAAAVAHAGVDPYVTTVELSDVEPTAPSALTLSFRAVRDGAEKLDTIAVTIADGMRPNPEAFAVACPVRDHGSAGAEVCAADHPETRIGSGSITIDLVGVHTVRGEAYRVEGGPEGADIVFFFPAGQVFGIRAQSIWGLLDEEATPPALRIPNIQDQLDLPFGATAHIEQGRFTLGGPPGHAAFLNPPEGTPSAWSFGTTLAWAEGEQVQRVRAVAAR